MPVILTLLLSLIFATSAWAQELLIAQTTPPRLEWSYQTAPATCTTPTPNATIRTRPSTTSTTYTTVATVAIPSPLPATVTYTLPATANNLYYTVSTVCGVSNEVQYAAVVPPGPTLDQRVTTLETKVSTLQLNEASDDATAAALATRVTSAEAKNAAQDTSVSALQGQIANLTADLMSATAAIDARLDALETVPPPPPAGSNLAVKDLNADQIEITGLNCTKLSTTGTGVKRIITCVH